MSENTKPVKVWRIKNIHLVSEENDIRFRGPLSYRHLRIAGWIFLLVSQIGLILSIASSLKLISMNPTAINIIKSSNSLMTPLFLIAAFAQVIVAKNGYWRLLRTYILGALGLFALFALVYFHFVVGFSYALTANWNKAFTTANSVFTLINSNGTLSFNIFIDLVLCTLVMFFINYRPTKYFQGKKMYIFRAFVALPILFEVGSIVIKMLGSMDIIDIHPLLIPLLTTKPPLAFLVFIALALFVKSREKHYIKHGKTHEEYKKFLNTNVNRLHFSLFLTSAIIVAVILDVILFIGIAVLKSSTFPIPEGATPEEASAVLETALSSTYAMGFGGCMPMILIVPLVMFFDYTKTYANNKIDMLIPVAGIALLLIVSIEGLALVGMNYLLRGTRSLHDIVDSESSEESSAKILFKSVINRFRS